MENDKDEANQESYMDTSNKGGDEAMRKKVKSF